MEKPRYNEEEILLLSFSRLTASRFSDTEQHMHAYPELFYFESGQGVLECGDNKISLQAHRFVAVNPNRLHRMFSTGTEEPLIYYNITLDRLHVAGMPQNCLSNSAFIFHAFETSNNTLYQNICMIRRELEDRQPLYAAKVRHLFHALIVDTLRLFSPLEKNSPHSEKKCGNREQLETVREYMEAHYTEELSLEKLARVATMQKSYFLQQFGKLYGIPPRRYLTLLRIESAKLLLISTEKNITEISAQIGYNHPAYFSEIFSKTVGISPTQYRRLITEQETLYPGTTRLLLQSKQTQI